MKLNKLLSIVLIIAMIISTMTISVFAEETKSLSEFAQMVAGGTYEGATDSDGAPILTVEWDEDETLNAALIPGGMATNGKALQYRGIFGGATDNITIKNVNFKFNRKKGSEKYVAEFQVYSENLTLENCTFDAVTVSAWGNQTTNKCDTATYKNCTFKNIDERYALHFSRAAKTVITGCNFINCSGGVLLSLGEGIKASSVEIKGNSFSGTMAEKRGLIQFAAAGDFSEANIAIQSNTSTADVPVYRQLNTTVDNDALSATLAANTFSGEVFTSDSIEYVAAIGTKKYASIQAAVDAAADGDTITLFPGVISEGAVEVDKAVTIVGAENLGSEITNTQFAIKAPVSFEGLKFTGNSYINISDKNASALTVKNCDVDVDVAKITGRAAFIIATNEDNKSAKVVLKDSIFVVDSPDDYYAGAMFTWSYLADGSEFTGNTFGSEDNRYNFIAVKSLNSANDAVITVSGNKVYGTGEAWYFSAFDLYQNNSRANNYLVISRDNEFDFEEGSYPAKAFYIEANTGSFGPGNALVYDNGSTVNDRELTLEDFEIQADAIINTGVDVELDADNKVVYGVFAKAFTDDSYVSQGVKSKDNGDGSYTITNVEKIADKVTVEFVEGENQGEFDLYVAAVEDDEIINRLKSVALQFALTEGFGYTLTPAANVTITEDLKEDNAYAFNYDGKGAVEDTAHAIKLASIKVEGVGPYTFAVVPTYDIAKASATEYSDNIEKTYVPADDTFVLVDSADNGIAFSGEIKESTRDIKVVIEFNNSIVKVDDKDYTDMDIKLVGGADNTEIVKNICVDGTNTVVDGVVVSSAVVFEDVTVPYRYTVTVSGSGYRTASYTNVVGEGTNEDDTLVLKFWNNVKDTPDYIEGQLDRSEMTKNFLAGDIVKDNNINKYDLSAVVSYFGTRQAAVELNKYDLNRDGNIDSEDIAYVLVSFGE